MLGESSLSKDNEWHREAAGEMDPHQWFHNLQNLGALTLLLQGLRTGNGDLISDGMHDRLHEPYRWRLIKGGQEVKEAALAAGAWGCAISGAGPSILALCCEEHGAAVSQAMVKAWESVGVASRAPLLSLQTAGSHWQPRETG